MGWHRGLVIRHIETGPYNPYSYTSNNDITSRYDGVYCYHTKVSTGNVIPIPGQNLPDTIDIFLVGGGGARDARSIIGDHSAGGGGEVIQASGVTAPVVSTPYVRGYGRDGDIGSIPAANGTFMGYTARYGVQGSRTNTDGGRSGAFFAGGVSVFSGAGGGGGGAAGVGQNGSGANGPTSKGGDAGPGIECAWAGTSKYYGVGGTGIGVGVGHTDGAYPHASVEPIYGKGQDAIANTPNGTPGILMIRYLVAN